MAKKKSKKSNKSNIWLIFSMIFFILGCGMIFYFNSLRNDLLDGGDSFMDGIGGILAFSSFGGIPLGFGILFYLLSFICFIIYVIRSMRKK